jgi:nucleolar pre-ribosomal-associated protein 2
VEIARNLNQSGPGENKENLSKLWKELSQGATTQGYAAEQASLRWLLKVMNPSTKALADHELVRRYPFTWNILDHLFKTIPLSTLVKALTDRKFIAVLQHTLDDLSNPSTTSQLQGSKGGSPKRKRTAEILFDLDVLRMPSSCIASAQSVFNALDTLFCRFGEAATPDTGGLTYDARTLFPSAAVEALKLLGPMFDLCDIALREGEIEACDRRNWTTIPTEIWALCFAKGPDAGELTVHRLCPRVFGLLLSMGFGRAEYQACLDNKTSETPIRDAWGVSLYGFLLRNIVGPTSRDFMFRNGSILVALVDHLLDLPPRVFLILYEMAQDCPAPHAEAARDKFHDWMNGVTKAISSGLQDKDFDTRSRIVSRIMALGLEKGTKLKEEMLETICTSYGFESDRPVWPVLDLALKIDPDIVFRKVGEETLLGRIRWFLLSEEVFPEHLDDVTNIAGAIVRAFHNRKNLGGLFKLWYEDLSRAEEVLGSSSPRLLPWLDTQFRYGNEGSWTPSSLAERFMTPSQVSSVLDWLLSLDDLRAGPTHVIVESLAYGLRSDEFTSVLGSRMVKLILRTLEAEEMPPPMRHLAWPALAKVVGWLMPEDRDALWLQVKSQVGEILAAASPALDRHLGAFKFLTSAWSAMMPDGELQQEVDSMLLKARDDMVAREGAMWKGGGKDTLLRCVDHLVLETPKSLV